MYGYLYVTDRDEGLILVPAGTLLDGNPLNNFLDRDVTFNPDDILKGPEPSPSSERTHILLVTQESSSFRSMTPSNPRSHPSLARLSSNIRAVQVQFRYAYACDEEGIKVLDVTDLAHPQPVSSLPLRDAVEFTWPERMLTSRPVRKGW